MEEYTSIPLQASYLLFPSSYYAAPPRNHVHWAQSADSHLFSALLPGVRKEEIRVEVEDVRYLVIRIVVDDDEDERRSFTRKFRLPELVDVDAISAELRDGVLTVTVPRLSPRRRLTLDASELAGANSSVAPAA